MARHVCMFNIRNSLDRPLTNVDYQSSQGRWIPGQPSSIGANQLQFMVLIVEQEVIEGNDDQEHAEANVTTISFRCTVNSSYGGFMWDIGARFSYPTKNPSDNFDFTASAEARTVQGPVACRLFDLRHTWIVHGFSLTVKIDIAYNAFLTTSAQLTSISIPANSLSPTVSNTKNITHRPPNGQDLVIWRADSLADYEDNSDRFVSGSFYPVAVDISNNSLRSLTLVVDVDERILGVPLSLRGGNDVADEVITSDSTNPFFFDRTGLQTIAVEVSPPWARPDAPWGVAGNIAWKFRVHDTGQLIGINSSRLEFYAINRILPAFFKRRVPVSLLRRNPITWTEHCCNAVFREFSYKYKTVGGGATYTKGQGHIGPSHGGRFELGKYLSDIGRGKTVNCYDQAGIMQICLGLAPANNPAKWIYMSPFGYIKTTDLVGFGPCNNPFFDRPGYAPEKVCSNDDLKRGAFGEHTFVEREGRGIVDACCGPHYGTLDLQGYIDTSIQTMADTILYREWAPGTVTSIRIMEGITDIY